MSCRKVSEASINTSEQGFTLTELLIAIVLIGIIGSTFLVFFKSSLFNYLDLQRDATSFTQLDTQAARITNVLRSATDVVSVADDDLTVYAYFYPQDTYVSLLHYYVATTGGVKQLKADLTPMSANPPIGSQITAQKRTFTVIDELYQPAGGKLFTYLSASGAVLSVPIVDLQTVKGIQVNLAAKTVTAGGNNQAITVQVSLRNRKTNL